MRFTEVTFDNATPIDGYGPGFFRIGGQVYEGPVLVLPNGVKPWGGFDADQPLLATAAVLDILFIGTGDDTTYLPGALRGKLENAGLNAEPMSTGAACRTFNVLLAEGRRVGAALLPVSST